MNFERKYGEAGIISGIPLITAGAVDYKTNPTLAAGDVQISKDDGAFTNLATLPTVTPSGETSVKISLSAAELTCKRAAIRFIDQTGTKEWEDQEIIIETYGHASAQHPNVGWAFALEANVELHVSNAINNTIPLYERTDGTLTADGTEQIIYEVTPTVTITPDSITMSLANMVANDRTIIRMYAKMKSGGSYELIDSQVYTDGKTIPAINITGQPNRYGWKVTLEQTAGVDKDYDWERYTLTT